MERLNLKVSSLPLALPLLPSCDWISALQADRSVVAEELCRKVDLSVYEVRSPTFLAPPCPRHEA